MKEDLNSLDLHDCEFKEIGKYIIEYIFSNDMVTIVKNSDNEWCYQPLGNPKYSSKGYSNLQQCLDDAYLAMVGSKL